MKYVLIGVLKYVSIADLLMFLWLTCVLPLRNRTDIVYKLMFMILAIANLVRVIMQFGWVVRLQ